MTSMSKILFLLSFMFLAKTGVQSSLITKNSTLLPGRQWPSPSGLFAFGFYSQDNGFGVGILLLGESHKTVVWTANRDNPPLLITSKATLEFTDDGELVLTTEQGDKRLIANETASTASMLDSGNFVLYDHNMNIIWQSFDFPTDTILGGQSLNTNRKLISSVSETNHSIGRFQLIMQLDGNLVMYPQYPKVTVDDAYWSTATNKVTDVHYHLYLNYTAGCLQLINEIGLIIDPGGLSTGYNSNNNNQIKKINTNSTTIYRATLDWDGVFRLYSHTYNGSVAQDDADIVWKALKDTCDVKGYCGYNSYCTHDDILPACRCLYQSADGCTRNYTEAGCKSGEANNTGNIIMSPMDGIEWDDIPYTDEPTTSVAECSRSCLEDCNCEAALFTAVRSSCKKNKLPLRYVKRDLQSLAQSTALLKIGKIPPEEPSETRPRPIPPEKPAYQVKTKKALLKLLLLTLSLVTCSCVFLAIFGLYAYKFRVLRYKRLLEDGNWGLTKELTLQLFSYDELRKATDGFKEELGKGSFGAVYKGNLYKGRETVAVKRLEKLVEEGEREFQAEMRAIGRTHHRNLVRLMGYCAEDSKRLLVYEYMSNGSLANLLFKATSHPDWNERMRIALDVARGVLYLHEECETPIIHCDIKPQNILMDDFWTAKISDFGLAKLLMGDQTRTFTGARGTRGYMAPEWQKNIPISVKADIYSFGIVLLEIVCCRRNLDIAVSKPEEIVLSTWVYRCFVGKELGKLFIGEEVDKKSLEKMVMVALWCIQDEPALRPSIKSVVMMLEGITEVPVPPCPTASVSYM